MSTTNNYLDFKKRLLFIRKYNLFLIEDTNRITGNGNIYMDIINAKPLPFYVAIGGKSDINSFIQLMSRQPHTFGVEIIIEDATEVSVILDEAINMPTHMNGLSDIKVDFKNLLSKPMMVKLKEKLIQSTTTDVLPSEHFKTNTKIKSDFKVNILTPPPIVALMTEFIFNLTTKSTLYNLPPSPLDVSVDINTNIASSVIEGLSSIILKTKVHTNNIFTTSFDNENLIAYNIANIQVVAESKICVELHTGIRVYLMIEPITGNLKMLSAKLHEGIPHYSSKTVVDIISNMVCYIGAPAPNLKFSTELSILLNQYCNIDSKISVPLEVLIDVNDTSSFTVLVDEAIKFTFSIIGETNIKTSMFVDETIGLSIDILGKDSTKIQMLVDETIRMITNYFIESNLQVSLSSRDSISGGKIIINATSEIKSRLSVARWTMLSDLANYTLSSLDKSSLTNLYFTVI